MKRQAPHEMQRPQLQPPQALQDLQPLAQPLQPPQPLQPWANCSPSRDVPFFFVEDVERSQADVDDFFLMRMIWGGEVSHDGTSAAEHLARPITHDELKMAADNVNDRS